MYHHHHAAHSARIGGAFVVQWLKQWIAENSEFKPVKLRLKADLVSYPTRAEGLINMNLEVPVV